jgi:hypothetical protein
MVGSHPNATIDKFGHAPIARRERRAVSLRAFVVQEDGSTIEALVLDLSYEGCGVETAAELHEGEAIKLSVLGLGMVEARVRWARGGKAGLVFEPDTPKAERAHWPRRYERTSLSAEVSLRRLGKFTYRVRVFDVSPDGCKVELVERPRLDEHLIIRFEGLESLEAAVCWVDGMTAGLHFERSIHPAVFAMLVERLQAAD